MEENDRAKRTPLGLPRVSAVFRGFSPEGEKLVQNAGAENRQPGTDVTFSPDKSVSAFYGEARPAWLRRAVEDSVLAAVREALNVYEETIARTRRGKAGSREEKARIVASLHLHQESRDGEPQLHVHAVCHNVCTREDGTTGTLISHDLYVNQKLLGALFRAELSNQLERRLRVVRERDRDNFRIRGVPKELCEFWSSRRKAILAELKAAGVYGPKAAELAALATRRKKEMDVSPRHRHARWAREAEQFGFSAEQVINRQMKWRNPEREARRAVAEAIRSLETSESHFTARDFLREVAVAAQGRRLSVAEVRTAAREALAHRPGIVRLGERDGQQRYTTSRILGTEEQLLSDLDALRGRRRDDSFRREIEKVITHYSAPRSVAQVVMQHHAKQLNAAFRKRKTESPDYAQLKREAKECLSNEQASAVRFLTRGRGPDLRILEGFAGTGKTRTLRVAREIWEHQNRMVLGVTLSGKAAKELRQASGIETHTHAMLEQMLDRGIGRQLSHHGRQLGRAFLKKPTTRFKPFKLEKNAVVVVDEAAMMSTGQLAKLANLVKKAHGTLVLVGDRQQLQAIEAGGAYGYQ
jgi:conjugative relaxase-like TrwC/TraI family protein